MVRSGYDRFCKPLCCFEFQTFVYKKHSKHNSFKGSVFKKSLPVLGFTLFKKKESDISTIHHHFQKKFSEKIFENCLKILKPATRLTSQFYNLLFHIVLIFEGLKY